jgi:hypothetical protein
MPSASGVVGAPPHRLDADVVDELGDNWVKLVCRFAPAAPVFAWAQFHKVLELEIHAAQCIGHLSGAALAHETHSRG